MTSAENVRPPEVLFFGTCLVDLLDPQAGLAAMRLIERLGIRVRFPEAQTCCSQPAYNAGFRDQARAVARLQLQALTGDQPVVVPSASCAGMFRQHYPRLFAGTPELYQALHLAERVVELCAFLHRYMETRPVDTGPPLRVALHQSCSARRETRSAEAALGLLSRFPNLTLVEPAEAEECCGFGGTFAVKLPEISAAIATDKVAAIRATRARVLVSQDLGCLANLDGIAKRSGQPLRTLHIATLLAERLMLFPAVIRKPPPRFAATHPPVK